MKVYEVMTRGIETVSSGVTLELAAKKMLSRNVGFLPVVDSERVIGVVTDRDIVLRAVAAGLRSQMTTVGQVMTKDRSRSMTIRRLVMRLWRWKRTSCIACSYLTARSGWLESFR